MAGGFTQEKLAEFIRENSLQQIKEFIGPQLAELVKENVAKALEPIKAQRTGGAAVVFGAGGEAQERKEEPGLMVARILRAVASAKVNGHGPDAAVDTLRKWGYAKEADMWKASREKALASNDPVAGGFLVPTQFSQEVIELLRPAAVVRSLNPMTLPMPTGGVKIPKITDGVTGSYIGENANLGKTEPKFGQISMSFKKLGALVPISNDLIRYSSPAADTIVRDDIVRAMAQREDKAFIRDAGTDATPKGIKYWIHSDNVLGANSSVSLANTTIDLGRCLQALMAADLPIGIGAQNNGGAGARCGWIFSPRTFRYLTTLQTTTGNYAFRDEMLRGTLWGYPYRVTTQVLETLTAADAETGGTQTEIYFGAFAHAVIGEALGMMVDASQEAAYHDGTNIQASFSLDQTVIRVMAEHDFALRHDKSFVRLKNVTWGV